MIKLKVIVLVFICVLLVGCMTTSNPYQASMQNIVKPGGWADTNTKTLQYLDTKVSDPVSKQQIKDAILDNVILSNEINAALAVSGK